MPVDPAQLLRRLEPAVRPGPSGAAAHRPNLPIERQDFDALLTMVASGRISSGRPVQCRCELSSPLDEQQLERLAAAADDAEAEGAQRAVMIIDGRAVVMDVPQRVIDTEVSAHGSARVFSGVDAAMYVPGPDDDAHDALPPFPGCGLVPGTVARQLERALLLDGGAPSAAADADASATPSTD